MIDMVLEYVKNLTNENYKEKVEIIINSINNIVMISSLSIKELSELAGLHRATVSRVLSSKLCDNKGAICRFKTYSKLNNFVRQVMETDSSDVNIN